MHCIYTDTDIHNGSRAREEQTLETFHKFYSYTSHRDAKSDAAQEQRSSKQQPHHNPLSLSLRHELMRTHAHTLRLNVRAIVGQARISPA